MKITLDIPDTTKGIIVCGLYANSKTGGFNMAQTTFDTDMVYDGAELNCRWEKENE